MNATKERRNQYIKEYDRVYAEISMHDGIILSVRKQWQELINKPRPLTINDFYKEQYLYRDFQTYRNRYEKHYEELREQGVDLSEEIMMLNIKLGYDAEDLYSDEE